MARPTKRTPQTTPNLPPPVPGVAPDPAILRELAERELCRRRLLAFVMRMHPDYKPGWVHREIARELEQFLDDVVNERSPRLMIFMPPRVGKSMLASEMFPSWALGKYPWLKIIGTSYGSHLAEGFSRVIRRAVREDSIYQTLFPTLAIDDETQAVTQWQLRYVDPKQNRSVIGGGYRGVGVGGALTGMGANILLVDDPVRNSEDANSEVIRDSTWDWYTTTARTRLLPGGGVLVIQTRWHDDDLSGRILSMMKNPEADQFKVISYSALATHDEPNRKTGEALHPERYDERAYAQIRASVDAGTWNALYQQNPVPDDGEFFKKADINYYNEVPPLASMEIYAGWDLAISKREEADFTAGFVVGIDADYNIYVLDRYHGRFGAEEIVQRLVAAQKTWHPVEHFMEREKVQMAVGPFIEVAMEMEGVRDFVITDIPPGRRDKTTRAKPLQGMVQRHKFYVPRGAEWSHDLVGEMLRFPKGSHDDQVDALAYIALNINVLSRPPDATLDKQPKSWRDSLWARLRGTKTTGHMAS